VPDREFLAEEDKKTYLREVMEIFQPLMEKHIFRNRPMGTNINVAKLVPKTSLGQKWKWTITHRGKMIAFSMEIEPWLWQDASVLVRLKLEDTRNLVIPSRKIEPKPPQSQIWRPGSDSWWFIKAFEPAQKYMKALQLTPVDVSLFDNLESAAKNLLKL
jgi:hypothetical protein